MYIGETGTGWDIVPGVFKPRFFTKLVNCCDISK